MVKFGFQGLNTDPDTNQQYAVLFCKDNGLGIPEDQWQSIFNNGVRAHADYAHGTGKGLYLVACAMSTLGGRIFLESEVGVGMTFYLLLPSSHPEHEFIG